MLTGKTSYDSSQKIWSGPRKENNYDPKCSVGEALFKMLTANPTNICQISDMDGVRLTNKEMLTISIRIAQRLSVEEGDIIGVMAAGSTYLAPVVYAALLNGTIVHPINISFDQKTLQHVLDISRPKMVFCDADNYDTLKAACAELNLKPMIYTINGRVDGLPNVLDLMKPTGSEDTFRPQKCKNDGNDTAMIVCSSGTTGLPKGVCLSHSYLLQLLKPVPSGTVIFTVSNIDWLSGLSFFLHSALSGCTRICTVEKYTPQTLRTLIEKYKINLVSVSAACMTTFIKSGEAQRCDFSSVRMFGVGGGNVSHYLYSEMQGYLKAGIVANVYVGTEFGGVSANLSIGKPKSVGQLLDGVNVRIVDDDCTNLGVGEVGEILVWNGKHWNGYYGNPVETKIMLDQQGWYHTGDVGFFDEDGDLHLVDRKKEIMKYEGYHFSTQVIENCILTLDDVVEVCVFGTKSDELGDLATAAVIKKPGSALTEKEIEYHVAESLPEKVRLHGGVFFVEEIPKTGTGKYIRTKARDMILRLEKSER